MRRIRPARLCRTRLFLEGASEQVLHAAAQSGADVLIHESLVPTYSNAKRLIARCAALREFHR
jgi:hypothetical protein